MLAPAPGPAWDATSGFWIQEAGCRSVFLLAILTLFYGHVKGLPLRYSNQCEILSSSVVHVNGVSQS